MTFFTYDGSFEGLLTTLRAIWQMRAEVASIRPASGAQGGLFADTVYLDTDPAIAAEVWHNLGRWLNDEGRARLYYVFLSEEPDAELLIYRYVRQTIAAAGRDISEDFVDDTVRRVLELSRRLGREKHRMEAFIRFEQTADGLFYAAIAPDVNVLPLLEKHFTARYADQRWLIYDERRRYGLCYDGHQTTLLHDHELTRPTAGELSAPAAVEPAFQQLWQTYYASVNIAARRNPRLHRRHLPLRYWKYLTEKQPRVAAPEPTKTPARERGTGDTFRQAA